MQTSAEVWLEAEVAQKARAEMLAAGEAALRRDERNMADREMQLTANKASSATEATRIANQADDLARARGVFVAERSAERARLVAREAALARAEEEHRAAVAEHETHLAHREDLFRAVERSTREQEAQARTASEQANRDLSASVSAARKLKQDEAALAERAGLIEAEQAAFADHIRQQRDEADQRQRALDEQRTRLAREEAGLDARRSALALGVELIEAGVLRSEYDIAASHDLRPAFAELASLARAVEHRVAAVVAPVTELLVRREAGLAAGEQNLRRREEEMVRREQAFGLWQAALQAGMERIRSGTIRTGADLDELPAVQPAQAVLGQIVAAVASAVERKTRGLAAARQQVLDQQGRAREAFARARAETEAATHAKRAAEVVQKQAQALRADAITRAKAANTPLRQARLLVETCSPMMDTLPATVAIAVRALAVARVGWADFKGVDRER